MLEAELQQRSEDAGELVGCGVLSFAPDPVHRAAVAASLRVRVGCWFNPRASAPFTVVVLPAIPGWSVPSRRGLARSNPATVICPLLPWPVGETA